MRDHLKLKAFHHADELALEVYRATRGFPKDELYGLTAQMRRAAVSVPSNIVEGCGRRTQGDYLHLLDVAFASLRELQYQVSLAHRLNYVKPEVFQRLDSRCETTSKLLGSLIRALRRGPPEESEPTK